MHTIACIQYMHTNRDLVLNCSESTTTPAVYSVCRSPTVGLEIAIICATLFHRRLSLAFIPLAFPWVSSCCTKVQCFYNFASKKVARDPRNYQQCSITSYLHSVSAKVEKTDLCFEVLRKLVKAKSSLKLCRLAPFWCESEVWWPPPPPPAPDSLLLNQPATNTFIPYSNVIQLALGDWIQISEERSTRLASNHLSEKTLMWKQLKMQIQHKHIIQPHDLLL